MSATLQDFTVSYGGLVAVDHLTAAFPPGSTGLLGPNGAGKSSLIKGLLGLVPLSAGSATVLGRDVQTERKAIRQVIGYMPEDDSLIPGLTGIGMVQYAGELCGMGRADAMQRAHEVLFLTGLEEARYRKVETYSSGMKQRIKLAQALVHDPQLLFLDEPTSGMDPKGRQEMLELIRNVADSANISIILASHILVDVERTCDRVVIMHRGQVLREGGVESMRESYAGVYSVRIDGDTATFRTLLAQAGCGVEEGERQTMEVTLPEGADTDVILRSANKAGVGVRKLVSSVQTLEDVFVKLVEGDEYAGL